MKKFVAVVIVVVMFLFAVGIFAPEAGSDAVKFQYIGVKKCKMCHKSEKRGMQFELWQKRGHAKAYDELASEESKKIAVEEGITGDPQKAKECLVCHVTAFDASADEKAATLTMEEGVSCEACHGPGSKYKSMKIMKDIYAGEVKGADYGLIEPNEELCVTCHNEESPTYIPFVYEKAVKQIAHPVPAKTKAKAAK